MRAGILPGKVPVQGGRLTPAAALSSHAPLDPQSAGSLSRATAHADAREFATVTRDWLENFLGRRWNQQWRGVGFENNTLVIPTDESGLVTLVERMGLYLSAHSAQENPNLNVTAARAGTLYSALTQARVNINAQCNQCGALKAARETAVTTLGRRIRGLCNELLQRIGRNDPRWREFGLNVPAAKNAPQPPLNVTLNNSTPGQLLVTCDPTANATYYRFFAQRVITDPEPVFVGRSDNPLFLITDLVPGAAYEVFVTAANASAESRFSEPATSVVTDVGEAAA